MRINLVKLRDAVIRPVPVIAIVMLVTAGLLLFRLTSLVPFGVLEQPQLQGSANVKQIGQDTIYAPIKGLQLFILKFTENDAYIRLASVFAALVSAYFLYQLLRKWHTARISLITTTMYVTSSWFLHTGRLSNSDVLFLTVIPVLIISCLWFLSKHHDSKLPLAAFLLAVLLYIPGSWLFIGAGLFVFRNYIFRTIGKLTWKIRTISILTLLAALAPLFYSFSQRPRQLAIWAGYDPSQGFTISTFAHNFLDIFKQLFWSGLDDGARWLSGTPVLDIFSIAMVLLGIYAYRTGFYPAREKLVFTMGLLSILLIGIGGVVSISLLIPIIYLLIANGISYMLQSWFTVFPKNPIARQSGIVLLCVVVGLSCFYQLQRYFVAWPGANDTKSALKAPR